MKVIISVLVLLIGMILMTISTIAGLIIVPIILLLNVLFSSKPKYNVNTVDYESWYKEKFSDHHIHVPIDTVPPMYYEAYAAYLKSPEWREFRKLVLKRDKYRCVDCGVPAYHREYCPTGEKLQVHHIHYDGIETMTFTMEQCVTVCPSCHDKRHGR